MNREDIIRWVKESTLMLDFKKNGLPYFPALEEFAALVAAAEREECAKVCGALANGYAKSQDFHALSAAEDCEAAIRYRGQE